MPLEHEGIRQIDMDRAAQIIQLRVTNAQLLAALEEALNLYGMRAYLEGRGGKHMTAGRKWHQQAHAAIEDAKK